MGILFQRVPLAFFLVNNFKLCMVSVEISVGIVVPDHPASGRKADIWRMATKMIRQSLKMRRLHGISALQKSLFFQLVKISPRFEGHKNRLKT